jgi:hypothetical protein
VCEKLSAVLAVALRVTVDHVPVVGQVSLTLAGVPISVYRYKALIRDDVAAADLVICHAGLGVCGHVVSLLHRGGPVSLITAPHARVLRRRGRRGLHLRVPSTVPCCAHRRERFASGESSGGAGGCSGGQWLGRHLCWLVSAA